MHHETLKNPDAPLLHVEIHTTDSQRDRFGNFVFASPEKAYRDREDKEVKSALLITQEGEVFCRKYPGILQDISRGLQQLTPKHDGDLVRRMKPRNPTVELGNGRRIRYLSSGAQSMVYVLEVPDGRYILKTHLPYSQVHQPYVNEMLQVQSLEHDCAADLQRLGIALPRFLFASGQMICTEYVPREASFSNDFEPTYYAAATTAEHYVDQQKRGDRAALWKNIWIDKIQKRQMPRANFREREDGTVVWIDPIAYSPNGLSGRPDVVLSADEMADLNPLSVEEMRDEYRVAAVEVGMFDRAVMDFDSSNDDAWQANAREEIRRYGVDPQKDPDHIPFAMSEVKHRILIAHNIEWMIEK